MSQAFVLGNGTSRLNINPSLIKQIGTVYACNAIYRDFTPDHLIAVDAKMIDELVANDVHKRIKVWTNPYRQFEQITELNVFNPSLGWSSGPTALNLATTMGHTEIYILGFDYQGIKNRLFNNVYADTNNYRKSTEPATYYGNWLKQTKEVIERNTHIKFYRVIEPGQFKTDWSYNNFFHIDYDLFKTKINYYSLEEN